MGKFSRFFRKVGKVAKKAFDWAKRTKAVSRALNMVNSNDPRLAMAKGAVARLGLGRRRRVRRMRGGARAPTYTNKNNFLNRSVAMMTYPAHIPKLSVQLRRPGSALGLAGNYR